MYIYTLPDFTIESFLKFVEKDYEFTVKLQVPQPKSTLWVQYTGFVFLWIFVEYIIYFQRRFCTHVLWCIQGKSTGVEDKLDYIGRNITGSCYFEKILQVGWTKIKKKV